MSDDVGGGSGESPEAACSLHFAPLGFPFFDPHREQCDRPHTPRRAERGDLIPGASRLAPGASLKQFLLQAFGMKTHAVFRSKALFFDGRQMSLGPVAGVFIKTIARILLF